MAEQLPQLEQPEQSQDLQDSQDSQDLPVKQDHISFTPEEWANLTEDLKHQAVYDEEKQKYILAVTNYNLSLKFVPSAPQSQIDAQTELILIQEKNEEVMTIISALNSPMCVLTPEQKKQEMHKQYANFYVILEAFIERQHRYRLSSARLAEIKKHKKTIEQIAPLEGLDLKEAAKAAREQLEKDVFEKVRQCTREEAELKLKNKLTSESQ